MIDVVVIVVAVVIVSVVIVAFVIVVAAFAVDRGSPRSEGAREHLGETDLGTGADEGTGGRGGGLL